MDRSRLKWAVVALAMGLCLLMGGLGVAVAQTAPASGLGQSWPNAQDVSANPQFHVYVFAVNGLKFIQVNDVNGTVRGGVAASPDGTSSLALPLGAGQLQAVTDSAPADGVTVYSDSGTTVTASPTRGLVASPSARPVAAADCTSVTDCTKIN
ncbi:hypothetical protein DyAD56_16020 [Dyella sp. AD56]|uniref:hypothetical protein n=1 Tax=Dyella sp. AD56 TaxID=1528744 RepID=UPI000CA8300E|nr:hypothetical protein [Dyella sp. AD56]PMQ04195.1 hypothetical protein DyAD56_16020 [Dyella sp. AD56]